MVYKVLDIGPNGTVFKIQTEGQPALWCKVEPTNQALLAVARTLKVGSEITCAYVKRNGYASFTNLVLGALVVPPVVASNPVLNETVQLPTEQKENEMVQKPTVGTGNNFGVAAMFTCATCGTPMKDGTYKTCYTCSMAAKAKGGTTATKTWGKTPEEQNSIKQQAIGHMVSRTLIGLSGHLDLNNIEEVIEKLYAKYKEVVG